MPANVANNAEALRAAYSEYQIRSLSRSGLRKIYIVTLSLTLLLVIFGAIASAFQIASNLARPLLLLAQGTKAVSEGNLSPRPIVSSNDELGTLTQSFNAMTHQLAEARAQAEKSRADLEAAKVYLESVLANMSAGVIVLDHEFKLIGCNNPVARILRLDLTPLIGQRLSDIEGLSVFCSAITKAFSEFLAQAAANNGSGDLHWQQQIEIPHNPDISNETDITLLARGSSHLVNNENRYIVVFDDITEVISAQRSIAWGEVARRLAHEIKNPLTPIQLSAERLQMKLHEKLSEQDAAILKKSTDTIVNQVTSMKQMVNDFRNFAKTPPAFLKPLDLNALAEEIVHLYSGNDSHETVHTCLATNLPDIMGDETQLRQVIHNLLQNAQDAVGEVQNREHYIPSIELITEKVGYQDASGKICIAVRLSVMDNGPGFAHKILARIFEPYITTKERGTGLGMAMVKKIVDEHGGRIDVQNRTDTNGAKVSILFLQLASPASQKMTG
jgi:nitrogen fixation/metabolism regulation signal transduction histidine kinase